MKKQLILFGLVLLSMVAVAKNKPLPVLFQMQQVSH